MLSADESYVETNAVSLSSDGEATVFALPQLRPQFSQDVITKENARSVRMISLLQV